MKVKINKKIEKMENKKIRKIYRQGDVLLYQLFEDELKEDISEINFVLKRDFVVREGETGNKHTLLGEVGVIWFEGDLLLKLDKQLTLKHEEHNPLLVEAGLYKVIFEREYDYENEAWRQVFD